ncbi:MAG: hypothetical protein JO076_08060 [Verrucomicrobia bacterium]|nr:hypothetical protein [Verrucomicrobiota bacterium]
MNPGPRKQAGVPVFSAALSIYRSRKPKNDFWLKADPQTHGIETRLAALSVIKAIGVVILIYAYATARIRIVEVIIAKECVHPKMSCTWLSGAELFATFIMVLYRDQPSFEQ